MGVLVVLALEENDSSQKAGLMVVMAEKVEML
jgi:hypothetical protein